MADDATRIRITATDESKAAFDSALTNLNALKGSALSLSGVVASVTASLASLAVVAQFTSFVKGAAALDDMAEKTGATVENLSALASVARISGVAIETVEGGLIKFAKALNGVNEEGSKFGKAFSALGLDPAKLRTLDTAEAFKVLADRLSQFRDDGTKTALILELLGKNGAQLLPYLKDLATTGDLQAKVTAEQAAQAENLEKNLNRLFATKNAGFKEFSAAVLPTVDAFVKAMLDAANAADGLRASIKKFKDDGSIQEWAETSAIAVAFVIDEFRLIGRLLIEIETPIERLGRNIYNLGQLAGIALSGNISEIRAAYKAASEEATREFAKLDERLRQNRVPAELFADRVKAEFAKAKAAVGNAAADKPSTGFSAGATGVDRFKDELKGIQSFVDQISERLVGSTEGEFERLRARAINVFRKVDSTTLDPAALAKFNAAFAQVSAQIDELEDKAVAAGWAKALSESFKIAGDAAERADDSLRGFNETQSQLAQDLAFELSLVGKLSIERQKLAAARKIDLDAQRAVAAIPDNAANRDERIADILTVAANAKQRSVELLDAIRTKSRDTFVGASSAAQDYFERVTDGALNARLLFDTTFLGMEDALVKFTTTGKADFKSLVDSILADLVRIQVRNGITGPLAKALGNSLGGDSGPEQLSGPTDGGGGIFDGFKKLFGFASGGRPPLGVPSMVGERGPELFVPDVAGTIVPNSALGGGGVTIVQYNSVDGRTDRASILLMMAQAKDAAKAEIMDSMNRGGAFAR